MSDPKRHAFATRAIHAGQAPDPSTGAIMTPIYATSTYVQQSPGVHQGYEYSRSQNPTRFAYEKCIADLENGIAGFAFASGLAAENTALDLLQGRAQVLAMDDLYGGTYRLFKQVREKNSTLDFTFADLSDIANLEAAITDNTRMIWVESPTNPMLKLVDLAAVARFAKSRGILTLCDNTFASPYFQRPLDHGFDLVLHSATKYLNGHSDMVGGVLVTADRELAERLAYLQNATGAVQGPFDSFMVLRSLKTLPLRMQRHSDTALQVARWLEQHDKVAWVSYAGLDGNRYKTLAEKYCPKGAGALFTFGLKGGYDAGVSLVSHVELFSHLANIGDTRSLIIHPASTTHRQLSDEQRALAGAGDDVVRLSIGLEDPDDIIADLDQALANA